MNELLTRHFIEGLPSELMIDVIDKPGQIDADNHRYDITGFDTNTNSAKTDPDGYESRFSRLVVMFQNGPVSIVGYNGVTLESLLAITEHRLQRLQNGPYSCEENQTALDHITKAIDALNMRTASCAIRNVEGT
jgi:hypothetical protein